MAEMSFRVFIPDPTYGDGEWTEDWRNGPVTGPSAEFRKSLEDEFGGEFRFTSIGTGAAISAYFLELASSPFGELAAGAIALFFAGKPIKDNLEAWGSAYKQLVKFFHRDPTFSREGAAVLVYEAVVDKMGGLPKSYELRGFGIQHRLAFTDPLNPPDPSPPSTIEEAPERVERAMIYVFHVVADGRTFLASVDGHNVKFLKNETLSDPQT
jgi:hypothetical protein